MRLESWRQLDLAGFVGHSDELGVYLGALGSCLCLEQGNVLSVKTSWTNVMGYLKFQMSKTYIIPSVGTSAYFLVKDIVDVVVHGGNMALQTLSLLLPILVC